MTPECIQYSRNQVEIKPIATFRSFIYGLEAKIKKEVDGLEKIRDLFHSACQNSKNYSASIEVNDLLIKHKSFIKNSINICTTTSIEFEKIINIINSMLINVDKKNLSLSIENAPQIEVFAKQIASSFETLIEESKILSQNVVETLILADEELTSFKAKKYELEGAPNTSEDECPYTAVSDLKQLKIKLAEIHTVFTNNTSYLSLINKNTGDLNNLKNLHIYYKCNMNDNCALAIDECYSQYSDLATANQIMITIMKMLVEQIKD